MNDIPDRLDQIDFSKNSGNREALRTRLLLQASARLPRLAQKEKHNIHLGFVFRLAAIAAALVAFIIGINWPSLSSTSLPPINEAIALAPIVNQIVSATFQAMTQDASLVGATPMEMPTVDIGQVPTAAPQGLTEEVQPTFLIPLMETPIPNVSQAPTSGNIQSLAQGTAQTVETTLTVTPRSKTMPGFDGPTILPNSLYFLRYDGNQTDTGGQIYRLWRDGKTISQITFEAGAGVRSFDVSIVQGKVVYIAGKQLLLADLNGANRQSLANLDGDFTASPRWSPDGQNIAYQSNGKICFYSMQTGMSSLILDDNTGDKVYSPVEFSPNNQKLLVRVNWVVTTTQDYAIFDIPSKTLMTLQLIKPSLASPLGYMMATWTDSSTIFGFYPARGQVGPGLWRVNADDGTSEPLIWSPTLTPMTGVLAPHYGTQGNLIYLYTLGKKQDSPLSLVQSAADGVTNRIAIRPETFYGFSSLWSPSGNGLLLLQTGYSGNPVVNLIFIPVDSSLPVLTLLPDASSVDEIFRWGP